MFLATKKKKNQQKKKKILSVKPSETVKYFHIFLHYSTVLKGSGSQCTEEKTSSIFFQDSPGDQTSARVTSLLFSLPFFRHTQK